MAWNAINPVTVGAATKKDHYDRAFDNILYLYDAIRGIHELFLPAKAFEPHLIGGCAPIESFLLSSGRYVQALAFDPTSVETASFVYAFPKSWNLGTCTFQPYQMNVAGGSGGIAWESAGVAAGDDETLDAAMGTFQTALDTILAAKRLMVGAESAAITFGGSPAIGDLTRLDVRRLPTHASDTYTADGLFLGGKFRFTTLAPTDV